MALRGQGDKRWIVEDREDGTNVNHWHWNEYDVSNWATKRLKELLSDCSCQLVSPWSFRVDSVEQVNGEATVYVRKGRVKSLCDLEVRGTWSVVGEKNSQDKCVEGSLSIELLSGEPEVCFVVFLFLVFDYSTVTDNFECNCRGWTTLGIFQVGR